jgi:hypothetical protein
MQINFTKQEDIIILSSTRNTIASESKSNKADLEIPIPKKEINDNYETKSLMSPRTEEFKFNKISTSQPQKNIVYIFDIEDETGLCMDLHIRIIKDLDGLSQLNFNNNLYLCGASMNNDLSGSSLLKLDPVKIGNNAYVLINSIYHHYYPTLLGFRGDLIVAIGGYKNKLCEVFNIKTNKWRALPDLPEERYKCCVINDDMSEFLYLFGGLNSESAQNCTSILRLNMKNSLVWETMIVKANAHLLAKNSCSVMKFDRLNVIYIIGGRDNSDQLTDTIIEYDVNSRIASLNRKRLECKASFFQDTGSDLNKSEFFIFDENTNIHKISKNDFKINMFEFKEVFNNGDS